MSYLEISTLEKTKTNRAIKIRVPIYLPQKRSKKTEAVNGIDYRSLFLEHLTTGEAYQVEIIRREGKYYCHITFTLPEKDIIYTGHNCHQYGMEVHNGAAMVIGRSYEFKEKIPKLLKDKLIKDKDIDKFNKKNEWVRWSEINKTIKREVGEKPGLWIEQRKNLLGVS